MTGPTSPSAQTSLSAEPSLSAPPTPSATRLSVRRRLPGGDLGDVVGYVVEDSADRLVLLPEDRPQVVIAPADVVARREVPPRAVRPSSSADDLARFLAGHWPGTEQARLGGWLLRHGGGFTRRANSCLVAGDPGMPDEAARDLVTTWYAERDTSPRLQVPGPPTEVPPGWTPDCDVAVLVGDLRRIAPGRPAADAGPSAPARYRVEASDSPDEAWLRLWRGGTATGPVERAVLTASPARYVVVHDSEPQQDTETAVACARLVVDRRWAHVSCVDVAPQHQGRGLGRAVMQACLDEAASHPGGRARGGGASFLAVEVETGNSRAMGLYGTMGMRTHHRYHYLVPDTGTPEGTTSGPSPAGAAQETTNP